MPGRARLGRTIRCVTVVGVVAGMLVPGAPAGAACHIAAFRDTARAVNEGAGSVRLVVYLVGEQPSCAGSVRYRTVNGTARAGRDYEARTGELTFTPADDREETITIRILDDARDERAERFTVVLSEGTQPGNIQPSTQPATVMIRDNDDAPDPAPTETASQTDEPEPTPDETDPSPDETEPDPKETDGEPSPSPTPKSPSPDPSEIDGAPQAAGADGDGGAGGLIAAVVLGALALAAGALWFVRRKPAAGAP